MIDALIDKQDSFEIIRTQIAAILATEVANQMALATVGGKDPDEWKLRIYEERSNPWEQWLGNSPADTSPIVNVWYENSTFDLGAGSTVERQKATGLFNVDCYGYGVSQDDGGTGHLPGDREAALAVQKAVRLVRNILMAGTYTYLSLRGLVWRRWPQDVTIFQPQDISNNQSIANVQKIVGARLVLQVTFNELSPQVPFETLELVEVDVKRTEDGQIIAETGYQYPLA